MSLGIVVKIRIQCNDCLEVMDAEEWQGHKCGNNYRVVESDKTIRAESDCSVCTRYSIEELRAHLRTLAIKYINCAGYTTRSRACNEERHIAIERLIDYAIENPTEE
jgi:hypothetical protein